MHKAFGILRQLRDGHPRSGAQIARELGITRSAVWHQVERLRQEGVAIYAVSGKGYQLPQGVEFLDEEQIRARLHPRSQALLGALTLTEVTDSTNQRLLTLAAREDIHGRVWLSEYQTAGRGRRGDQWLAPPGSSVCLSLGWRFDVPPPTLSALSLVVGIALIQSLQTIGARDIAIKWPNDVLYQGRKLAGILIEMRSEFGGPCTVVIGIGVNVTLAQEARDRIAQGTADLAEACAEKPGRNLVASAMLNALVAALQKFQEQGFAAFAEEWERLDALRGQRISIQLPDRTVSGIARGVDAAGTLLLERQGRLENFMSGHVRLEAGA